VEVVGSIRVFWDTYDKKPTVFERAQWEDREGTLVIFREERRVGGSAQRVVLATFEPGTWGDVVLLQGTNAH
jgi:hypothetical protein